MGIELMLPCLFLAISYSQPGIHELFAKDPITSFRRYISKFFFYIL